MEISIKSKLKRNELTIGSWISIGHPAVVEVMSSAGFEWLVVDMEHTATDHETLCLLISTIQAKGMKAFVRVSKNEEVAIKKALDMGADGLIIPMVNSRELAEQAVGYSFYPPHGIRGVGLYRAQGYGTNFNEYKDSLKDNLVIIAQIEHINAVENISEIVSVDGIDGCLIGPYDLSGSMGMPGEYFKPEVQSAIERVLSVCKEKNFPSGFHVIESDPIHISERVKQGCTFLAYSIDFFFLGDKARQGMKELKGMIE